MNEGYEKIQSSRRKTAASPVMRSAAFWARNVVESIGITIGAAFGLNVLMALQINTEFTFAAEALLATYGYYLMMAGMFVLMMYVMGVFQTYYSLLVSMNVTRRATAVGIVGSTGILALCVVGLMGVIWSLTSGEVAQKSLNLLPLFSGIIFALTGVMLLIGVVIARWGKIGAIILTVIAAIGGGCFGAGVAIGNKDILSAILKLSDMDFRIMTVIGAAVFAGTGIFTVAATRKLEVRR